MVVTGSGNRLDAPEGNRVGTPLRIRAALYNGQRITKGRFSLPAEASSSAQTAGSRQ
jgi:hypothetical protein